MSAADNGIKSLVSDRSSKKPVSASWKAKAALAAGVAVPLGLFVFADAAAAEFGSSDNSDDSYGNDGSDTGDSGFGLQVEDSGFGSDSGYFDDGNDAVSDEMASYDEPKADGFAVAPITEFEVEPAEVSAAVEAADVATTVQESGYTAPVIRRHTPDLNIAAPDFQLLPDLDAPSPLVVEDYVQRDSFFAANETTDFSHWTSDDGRAVTYESVVEPGRYGVSKFRLTSQDRDGDESVLEKTVVSESGPTTSVANTTLRNAAGDEVRQHEVALEALLEDVTTTTTEEDKATGQKAWDHTVVTADLFRTTTESSLVLAEPSGDVIATDSVERRGVYGLHNSSETRETGLRHTPFGPVITLEVTEVEVPIVGPGKNVQTTYLTDGVIFGRTITDLNDPNGESEITLQPSQVNNGERTFDLFAGDTLIAAEKAADGTVTLLDVSSNKAQVSTMSPSLSTMQSIRSENDSVQVHVEDERVVLNPGIYDWVQR